MKQYFTLSIIIFTPLYSYRCTLFNNTDTVMHITWKSNALGSASRQGYLTLYPYAECIGCISTYKKNCVHILYIESSDKQYRIRSKPFCRSSRIRIDLKKTKSWFGKTKPRLMVTIEPLEIDGESI